MLNRRGTPRQQILAAANRVTGARRLTMRHLNEAVCIVRHYQLVKPEVLVAAGFNATKRH